MLKMFFFYSACGDRVKLSIISFVNNISSTYNLDIIKLTSLKNFLENKHYTVGAIAG